MVRLMVSFLIPQKELATPEPFQPHEDQLVWLDQVVFIKKLLLTFDVAVLDEDRPPVHHKLVGEAPPAFA
jgi:hypothetical protein